MTVTIKNVKAIRITFNIWRTCFFFVRYFAVGIESYHHKCDITILHAPNNFFFRTIILSLLRRETQLISRRFHRVSK